MSEETKDSPDRLEKKNVWIVDPIDGTKEFIKGVPEFVVSIGLVKNGEPIIGVIYNPITEEIFYAKKNGGSFLNDRAIKCVAKENISEMTLLNSRTETKNNVVKTSVIITFHPAFLMRQPAQKKMAWIDLKMIRDKKI